MTTASPTLDGPRLPPVQPPARQLVVLLHGYGADGNDLIGLGEAWAEALPQAMFVSPHAPYACGIAPMGREWFPLRTSYDRTAQDVMDDLRSGVTSAAAVIDGMLDTELRTLGLGNQSLALVGFSQGAALALHVGLRRPARAIVGYSGALGPLPTALPEPKPRVLLYHGDADAVVAPAALHMGVQALTRAGITPRWHMSPGLPHGIDQYGLQLGAEFLREAFRNPNQDA